jgi:hypothetical protein
MTIGRYEIARRSGGARALDARKANDRIAEKAERLRFVSRVPMLCECSDVDCRRVVMVRLEDYYAIRCDSDAFVTTPGHSAEESHLESETAGYDVRHDDSRRDDDELRSA